MARKGESAIGVAPRDGLEAPGLRLHATNNWFLATREERLFSTKRAAETSNANSCRFQSLLRGP
jgi:hypothetical protein